MVVLIAPHWQAQTWFPALLELLVEDPLLLPRIWNYCPTVDEGYARRLLSRPEPIMLSNFPIILLGISQIFYPLFPHTLANL